MEQFNWLNPPNLPTEKTFDRFVKSIGGEKISDFLAASPTFQNADYLFRSANVVAELKTLQTDFGKTNIFRKKYIELLKKHLSENSLSMSDVMKSNYPENYVEEFLRLFRPALGRIIKKANDQIKSAKRELEIPLASGILILANDDFLSLEPRFVLGTMSEILTHSYSSVDAVIYLTLNHYIEVPDNDYANLVWFPHYTERAPDTLVDFIDNLGFSWKQFLECEIGEFDNYLVGDDLAVISNARAIPRKRNNR